MHCTGALNAQDCNFQAKFCNSCIIGIGQLLQLAVRNGHFYFDVAVCADQAVNLNLVADLLLNFSRNFFLCYDIVCSKQWSRLSSGFLHLQV